MDENIIQSIYKSCDENNADSVAVSSLIEFIKPYMPNNENELVELKLKLDPNDSDPHVDSQFFQQTMSDWIAKISEADDNNTLSEFPANLNQSLSPSSALMSSYLSKSNNNNTINETPSEEFVQRLTLQLNKATTDLNLVRQQLAASEEQNEALLAELNGRRLKTANLDKHASESLAAIECQNEEITEEVNVVSKRCEQLERNLANSEKLQQKYLTQIDELEHENANLKNKVQLVEKTKRESRKSLTDMRDTLDEKDSEISTLTDIIENLKCELEEKTEVATFYANEHKLYKQKTHELETLLKTRISHNSHESEPMRRFSFNTPKLLSQLARPVSPNLSTASLKGFNTSSPLRNCSFDSVNSSNSDLMPNAVGVVSVLRSPHKTLKEELAEISYTKLNNSGDEIQDLCRVAKDQEDIKNSLWENLKQLTSDNEMLLDYKKEYFRSLQIIEEKEDALVDVTKELEVLKRRLTDRPYKEVLNCLDAELSELEKRLLKQKIMGMRSQIKLKRLNGSLSKKIKTHEQMNRRKVTTDQGTQTLGACADWNVNVSISEHAEPKHTNYAKLELKMDRLRERKEKIERDLAREKAINVKLTLKCEEKCLESIKLSNKLEALNDKLSAQEKSSDRLKASNARLEILAAQNSNLASENDRLRRETNDKGELSRQLALEKRSSNERLEILTAERSNLDSENGRLRDELANLVMANRRLEENIRDTLKKLALEAGTSNQLRVEIEFLMNAQRQMKGKIQEDLKLQFHLKKELADLRNEHSVSFKRLRDEFSEKCVEIRTLRKEVELADGRYFLYSCSKELRRALEYIYDCFKSDDDLIKNLSNIQHPLRSDESSNMDLENQMIILLSNITEVTSFLHDLCNTQVDSSRASGVRSYRSDILGDSALEHDNSEVCNEEVKDSDESFISCSSEFAFSEEIPEITQFECDSFLDSLQMEHYDLRDLSKKEMEEKFTALALMLTVDVTTLKKRNVTEKDGFQQWSMKFFSCLNYSMHLLSNVDCHPRNSKTCQRMVYANLQQLKEISHDMLRTAVRCGVLDYENKVADCWRLIISYVATLSQENRRICDSNEDLEVRSFPSSLEVQHQATTTEDFAPAAYLGYNTRLL